MRERVTTERVAASDEARVSQTRHARRTPVAASVSRPVPSLERLAWAAGAVVVAAGSASACHRGDGRTTAQSELVPAPPMVTAAPAAPPGPGGVLVGLAGFFAAPGAFTTASAHDGPGSGPRAVPGQVVATPAPAVRPPASTTSMTPATTRPPHYYPRRGVMASVRPYPRPYSYKTP